MLNRVLLILGITISLGTNAQDLRSLGSKEFGVGLGNFYYLGELNQEHFNAITPGLQLSYRINITRRIGFNFNLGFGEIEGADSLSNIDWNRNRNLHFRSKIQEFGVLFEINYFEYQLGNKKFPFSPYLYFGLSAFHFNPQALTDDGANYRDLQPIGTEGQNFEGGSPYKLFNFAVPFGVGIRVNVVKNLGITLFTGMRRTYTDYLDDVSSVYSNPDFFAEEDRQFVDRSIDPAREDGTNTGLERGNNRNKDWYNHTGFMLSFKIQKKRNMCPAWYAN
ncbi:type IX secretion system protein PorG [Luteibaculum oceani]|uniref:DUF6089 domain-containing protein n=1 Tax=Luteibaculum oceani TaxID=1294296 RepID=A0A5C6V5I6_9FLAO|nr:DUF6089 family protein [Luteibaculum oceani]TXC78905.1 hypothetical protein FRX97_06740 [Luteibaculum oceani]